MFKWGFVVLMSVSMLSFRILDIEYEMTLFAFYYVGIGAAVFLLGYFQVCPKMSLFSYKKTPLKLDPSESSLHPLQSSQHDTI